MCGMYLGEQTRDLRAEPTKSRPSGFLAGARTREAPGNSTTIPTVSQIKLHPSCTQTEPAKLSQSKGITITAYSPLGSTGSPLSYDEVVKEVTEKKGVSPHTILVSLRANTEQAYALIESVILRCKRLVHVFTLVRRNVLWSYLVTNGPHRITQ